MSERRDGPGPTEAELTPAATLTPEIVRDVRERARRRDRNGWEYCTVPVEVVYALCDAADELAREHRRVAAALAVLNAPMWEPDDETDNTICRCESCLAETATLAETYRCRECGYRGRPMAWGCLDQENVERMSRERGERYDLGNVTCPVCGERELEADPWRALRAIRQALAADAPGQGGGRGGAMRIGHSRGRLLTLEAAAEELGITVEGLRARIARDEIAAVWPGDSGPDDPVFVGTGAIATYREWRARHRDGEGASGGE